MADSLKQIIDKPGSGSPSLNSVINLTGDIENIVRDTDSTFAANSDLRTPSQKAVKTALATKANVITYVQTALANDVTLTNAGQWYDGPAVTLSAGTWFLSGQIMVAGPAGNFYFYSRLWDGTTTAVQDNLGVIGGLWGIISQSCIVVISSGTPSWRMAGYCGSTGAKIYATPYSNLCAIKIA